MTGNSFKVDWRILGFPAIIILSTTALINIGSWKGGMEAEAAALESRVTKTEQCIEKLSLMRDDISIIKGYLEGKK